MKYVTAVVVNGKTIEHESDVAGLWDAVKEMGNILVGKGLLNPAFELRKNVCFSTPAVFYKDNYYLVFIRPSDKENWMIV